MNEHADEVSSYWERPFTQNGDRGQGIGSMAPQWFLWYCISIFYWASPLSPMHTECSVLMNQIMYVNALGLLFLEVVEKKDFLTLMMHK